MYLLLLAFVTLSYAKNLIFCPCMGRFGNQLDHYLSMIKFAHDIGRRLILPPLILFKKREIELVPFDSVFRTEKLAAFLDISVPDEFPMQHIDTGVRNHWLAWFKLANHNTTTSITLQILVL